MEICNIDSCGEAEERRLAEHRLLERERHYHDIFHNLSDAIYLVEVTEDNRFLYLETNRAFETMMGVTEGGMLGKTVGDLLRLSGAEASAEHAISKFRRCLELGHAISGEISLDTPSGRRILNSTLTPLFDDSGRINRILGTSRDVTASKQAERLNDFLAFALDQANDAVFLIDPADNHRFRYINDQACRSLGYSRDELLNMSVPDIDPYVDLEAAAKLDEQIRKQAFIRLETFHRRKDGQVFPVEVSGADLEYEGQTMVLTIVRDISERKRIEQEIAAREQEYRNLAENSPDSIIRYDLDGRIRYLNSGLLGYLGLSATDVIGKRPSEAWPDGRYAEIEHANTRAVAAGESTTVEFSETDAVGALHFNQISIVPERDADGQITGTLAVGRDVTAIRVAERQLSHFVDNLPGMAYSFRLSPDGHGSMPFASSAIEEYYGLRPEDVKDDMAPAHRLVHPDDLSIIEATIAEAARTMTPFRAEYRLCRPNLPERWLEARSLPERQADGSILWNGIVLDISERKRAEIALMASERMLSEAQAIAKLGSWDWDVVKNRVEWSDMAYDIYTPDARPAAPGYEEFKQSVHPDDLERVDAAVRSTFEHDTPFDIEHRVVSQCKGVRIVHAQAKVFRDHNGNPIRMLGTVQDITERKLIERQLRASEERMRLFFERQLVGMAITSPEKGWLQANDKICEMFGFTREELAKLTWAELTYPDDLPADVAQFERMLNGEIDSYAMEKRYLHKDGRIVFIDLSVGCVRREDGSVDYVLALLADITERKRMEEERRAHLHFFESMDRVNRAIQGSNDLETVLNKALDTLLSIFDCDRAYLIYPCDPEADSWSVPFERTRPEYPGALDLGLVMPMDEGMAATFRILLNAEGPTTHGLGNEHPLPEECAEQFGFKSFMAMILYPIGDKPWAFGIQQCSKARVWSPDEQKLFQEIGRRLADALTGLLAYREIQEHERQFRTLAENLPDNIVRYNREGVTVYVNPALERTLGNVSASMIGTIPREYHSDGSFEDYAQLLDAVLASGKAGEIEKQLPGPKGSASIHQIRIVPEHCESGEVTGALAIGRDVTQKRQLELELIRNERKFRTLVKNSPGFIGRFDTELRRTYVNQAYEETTKISEDEVLGKTPLEYWRLTVPDAEEFCAILRRVMVNRRQERIEAHAVTATGAIRYFTMHMVPEFDEEGEVDGVLTTGIEITDMKNAERLRVEAREDERKMLARELHDDLGQRLTALRLDIALLELRFGNTNAELLAKIKDMDVAVGETVKIVRSLLNMLRPAILDLGLAPALEWLAAEFQKRSGTECRLRLPKQNPALNEAQSIALFRIVQESLTNIAKYAQAKKVSIALTQEGGCHLLEIQDDGNGFDLDASQKTGSFGLKGIAERVQMLGGKLSVNTAPGRGVKLVVQLPR